MIEFTHFLLREAEIYGTYYIKINTFLHYDKSQFGCT